MMEDKMLIMVYAAFTMFLIAAALYDFYSEEVPLYLYVAAACSGLMNLVSIVLATLGSELISTDSPYYTSAFVPLSLGAVVAALIPAVLLLILYLLKGGIGLGDVLVFAISAFYLPGYENIELFIYSALVSGVVGIGFFIYGKIKNICVGAKTYPFIPCIFAGWIMELIFHMTQTVV